MGYKFKVTTSKDKIINIKNKYDEMVSYFLGIDIGIRMASRKTSVKEKAIHLAYQALGACLRPYKDFLRRQTRIELS